ncbi:hypothetical protein CR513_26250, partial [Mucuna pruriens]
MESTTLQGPITRGRLRRLQKEWRIITHGGFIVAKSKLEWNQDDFNLLQLNAQTRCIINYALYKSKINKFYSYKITKKMWDAFRITRDGIEDV